jgi:CheY-like chemotaxis protein/anti-sigma regulatory factor (Ser/Thr protein kinase)
MSAASLPTATLLLIDDEPVALRLASGLLRRAFPHYAIETSDGSNAVELIGTLKPDLVITDLFMPDVDGLTIVSQLRARQPDLPVIVMTANGSEEAAVKALRVGAASYVPKQRLGEELVEVVRWVLAVRAQRSRHEDAFDYMTSIERHFVLPNRSDLIAPIVTELQSDLRRLEVCPEEDLVRFGVAMTETLMNAMIHGNLGLPGKLLEHGHAAFHAMVEERLAQPPYCERHVYLDVVASRREVTCTIRDEGEGFAPAELPDPTDPEMLCRPHGRGLLLIRTFMDEMTHNAKGNVVTLVKRSFRPGPP